MTFSLQRRARKKPVPEPIKLNVVLFLKNLIKARTERPAKKKARRSVRPEIQETFSKWSG